MSGAIHRACVFGWPKLAAGRSEITTMPETTTATHAAPATPAAPAPQEQIMGMVLAFWQSRALAVSAELELPDLLAEGRFM
jgi:hypothetical protein